MGGLAYSSGLPNCYIGPVECFHRILSLSTCSWIKETDFLSSDWPTASQAPADSAVKTLPNLLHARVGFLTASSAPAHWKVLTSASTLHLQSFVFRHRHLKHASSRRFCSLGASSHQSFVQQKHRKKQKLTAP